MRVDVLVFLDHGDRGTTTMGTATFEDADVARMLTTGPIPIPGSGGVPLMLRATVLVTEDE